MIIFLIKTFLLSIYKCIKKIKYKKIINVIINNNSNKI